MKKWYKNLSKKKRLGFIITMVLALTLVVGVVWAYINSKLQKHVVNNFYPADVDIAVEENGDDNKEPEKDNDMTWEEVEGLYVVTKEVAITNVDKNKVNNAPAYIKVCLIPHWITNGVDASGSIDEVDSLTGANVGELEAVVFSKDGLSYKQGDLTYTLADNWSDSWFYNPNNGYFYYKKPLAPGEKTQPLLKTVSIVKNTKEAVYGDCELRLDVLSDAIQSEGNAVTTRWGKDGISINSDTMELSLSK